MEYIDQLIAAANQRIASLQRPASTYRLQFFAGFGFSDAMAVTDYLRNLGVTDVYASPYLKARRGSAHGYDVVDHGSLNPELGTREEYDLWTSVLKRHGLSHIADIVPNHMGVAANDNGWWNDVLKYGKASAYASYFDITWAMPARPDVNDKVLLPILGEPYGEVLEKGQLSLSLEAGRLALRYFDRALPLSPQSAEVFFGSVSKLLQGGQQPMATNAIITPELETFSKFLATFKAESGKGYETPERRDSDRDESAAGMLTALYDQNVSVRKAIENALTSYNGSIGHPRSFDSLDSLISQQHYRLAYWRSASDKINYRRFFDISDFAAIRMEHATAFQESHRLIFQLIAEGRVTGLRIDHPDGLLDPAEYLRSLQVEAQVVHARTICEFDPAYAEVQWTEIEPALRRRLRQRLTARDVQPAALYVVVEKILAPDETLPADWVVAGTSGYEFLNKVSGLFVDGHAAEALTATYQAFTGLSEPFPQVVHACKCLVLDSSFASELELLATQAYGLAQQTRIFRDIGFCALKDHLRELVVCFPVYRSYVMDGGASAGDAGAVDAAISRALSQNPKLDAFTFSFLRSMVLLEAPAGFLAEDIASQRRFAGKFQQLTSPVTAKGVEDTAFYRYHRLTSLNEVGGDPDIFGIAPQALHDFLTERQAHWPCALSPLSTHDTKRGEDVRARLHALADMPTQWSAYVRRWHDLNAAHRRMLGSVAAPSANDEYLFYQTILGAWPFGSSEADERFIERITKYMLKAARESKAHTSWTDPDGPYETALKDFVAHTLGSQPFIAEFLPFVRYLSRVGVFTSLSQTTLRLTAPGVPDTYQGGELWDLNLVDPDNRRPVDYPVRRGMLEAIQRQFGEKDGRPTFIQSLLASPEEGAVKMHVVSAGLQFRRAQGELFERGEYVPLQTKGERANNLFAFLRRLGEDWALVAVPRLVGGLIGGEADAPMGEKIWGNTVIQAAAMMEKADSFYNVFTGQSLQGPEGTLEISASKIFEEFPVALLASKAP